MSGGWQNMKREERKFPLTIRRTTICIRDRRIIKNPTAHDSKFAERKELRRVSVTWEEGVVCIPDGTGLYHFHKKHCEHCLRREDTDPKTGEKRTILLHHVLEAKLLCAEMVLRFGSEFIEYENEDVEKQVCERKAFYRLAERLKKQYPRLPLCLVSDSLYACEPVFTLCEKYGWKCIIRFKDGSIPTVA